MIDLSNFHIMYSVILLSAFLIINIFICYRYYVCMYVTLTFLLLFTTNNKTEK